MAAVLNDVVEQLQKGISTILQSFIVKFQTNGYKDIFSYTIYIFIRHLKFSFMLES